MTRRALSNVLVIALLLGAANCTAAHRFADTSASLQGTSRNAAAELGGTSWQLVKFQGGDDTTLTPDDKTKYTIAFGTDGHASVRIDCNRGRATWKSPGPNQLQLGPLAHTRAMCPPGSLHDRIVKHWAFVRSYVINDGHLFLSLMADGGIYEFEPVSQAGSGNRPGTEGGDATESLENTYWRLTRLGDASVPVASPQREPHLLLNSETRRVGGSGGCNRLMASYELKGDQLTFGQMAGTMMACPEGMETEKAFLEALKQVSRWKIAGQDLELIDGAGNAVARLEARHME